MNATEFYGEDTENFSSDDSSMKVIFVQVSVKVY